MVWLGDAQDEAAILVLQVEAGATGGVDAEANSAWNAREAEQVAERLNSWCSNSVGEETESGNVLVDWSLLNVVNAEVSVLVKNREELDSSGLWAIVGAAQPWSANLSVSGLWNVEDKVAVVVLDVLLGEDWVDLWILDSEWWGIVLRRGNWSCGSDGSEDGSNEDLGELHLGNYKSC